MNMSHARCGRSASKTGTAKAKYLTGEKDNNGQVRDEVRILYGDPFLVASVVDGLNFKTPYTECAINWKSETAPTDEQMQDVLAEYKATAFAGMAEDRIAFAAVMHRDGDDVHIHTFSANVDLQTNKNFNPAPPGHEKKFRATQDYLIAKHNFADPAMCKRDVKLEGHWMTDLKTNQIKQAISKHIRGGFENGTINNRDDVINFIESIGAKVSRQTDKSISIKDPENLNKRAVRLEGILYERHTSRQSILNNDRKKYAERNAERTNHNATDISRRRGGLEKLRNGLATENIKRFGETECVHIKKDDARQQTDLQRNKNQSVGHVREGEMDSVALGRRDGTNLISHLDAQLGRESMVIQQDSKIDDADRQPDGNTESIERAESGRDSDHTEKWNDISTNGHSTSPAGDLQNRAMHSSNTKKHFSTNSEIEENKNHGINSIRNSTNKISESIRSSIQSINTNFNDAIQQVNSNVEKFIRRTSEFIKQAVEQNQYGVGNYVTELQTFARTNESERASFYECATECDSVGTAANRISEDNRIIEQVDSKICEAISVIEDEQREDMVQEQCIGMHM